MLRCCVVSLKCHLQTIRQDKLKRQRFVPLGIPQTTNYSPQITSCGQLPMGLVGLTVGGSTHGNRGYGGCGHGISKYGLVFFISSFLGGRLLILHLPIFLGLL